MAHSSRFSTGTMLAHWIIHLAANERIVLMNGKTSYWDCFSRLDVHMKIEQPFP